MRNLAKIIVIVAACLAMADAAGAMTSAGVAGAMTPVVPFVEISLPRTPIHIGTVMGPGLQHGSGQSVAHVVANCAFRVEASFQTFRHEHGKAVVSAKDLTVTINGTEIPVGTGRVAVAESPRATPAGGIDFPFFLKVGVTGLESYPAGRYGGALVLKVMAAP
jgi:hypothetical protein